MDVRERADGGDNKVRRDDAEVETVFRSQQAIELTIRQGECSALCSPPRRNFLWFVMRDTCSPLRV